MKCFPQAHAFVHMVGPSSWCSLRRLRNFRGLGVPWSWVSGLAFGDHSSIALVCDLFITRAATHLSKSCFCHPFPAVTLSALQLPVVVHPAALTLRLSWHFVAVTRKAANTVAFEGELVFSTSS